MQFRSVQHRAELAFHAVGGAFADQCRKAIPPAFAIRKRVDAGPSNERGTHPTTANAIWSTQRLLASRRVHPVGEPAARSRCPLTDNEDLRAEGRCKAESR